MKIGTTTNLIPQNIAPENVKSVAIFDGDSKICDIPLGHLAMPNVDEKLYTFGLLSDVHLTKAGTVNDALTDFPRALQYFNKQADFVCICGDGVHEGTVANFEEYKSQIETNSIIPVYSITGNHEAYSGLSGDEDLNSETTIKEKLQ